jgi:hypothetical protein
MLRIGGLDVLPSEPPALEPPPIQVGAMQGVTPTNTAAVRAVAALALGVEASW